MKTELEKRVEKAAEKYAAKQNHTIVSALISEADFKAGAKFILEMPEVREFFASSSLLVSSYLSHFDHCDSLYEDEGACNCGLDTEEQCFNNALSKLRELGVV